MFETAETGQKIDKQAYTQLETELRTQLIEMQRVLTPSKFPVLVLIAGDDPAGVRDVTDLLSEWMDPRFVATHVFGEPTDEEVQRPRYWRYWRALPPRGRIGVYTNDWSVSALADFVAGRLKAKDLAKELSRVRAFERELAADGAVIIKLWLHLPGKNRRKSLLAIDDCPLDAAARALRKQLLKHPKKVLAAAESFLQQTALPESEWHLIESTCRRYRNVSVAKLILEKVKLQLERAAGQSSAPVLPKPADKKVDVHTVLDTVDLSRKLEDADYLREVADLQADVRHLAAKAQQTGLSVVAGFEGWDAAGKGGTIRRLAQSMSASMYQIIPVAAPTEEERAYQYLWRFWRHIPRAGRFVIFDRTWYGRVLVERVEGFASESEWRRAYEEINDFEQQIVDHGDVLLKFWLHIDKDEQLRRFQDREKTAFKQYKIGPDDYRNREKWDAYEVAINEMVARTSTPAAPWHIIPSNDKKLGRVEVLRHVVKAMKKAL